MRAVSAAILALSTLVVACTTSPPSPVAGADPSATTQTAEVGTPPDTVSPGDGSPPTNGSSGASGPTREAGSDPSGPSERTYRYAVTDGTVDSRFPESDRTLDVSPLGDARFLWSWTLEPGFTSIETRTVTSALMSIDRVETAGQGHEQGCSFEPPLPVARGWGAGDGGGRWTVDSICGPTTWAGRGEVVGNEAIRVGEETIGTVHMRLVLTVAPPLSEMTTDSWFDPVRGMIPVRIREQRSPNRYREIALLP